MTSSINKTQALSQAVFTTQIPVIDLADNQFGHKLVQCFKNIGFVIIKNHGISQNIINEAFQASREVFQLSSNQKQSVGLRAETGTTRGYTGPGQEILDQKNNKNQKKQTFDLGHPEGPGEIKYYPENQKFRTISKVIYEKLFELYKKIMVSMEKGLYLESGIITNKVCKDFYKKTLRYLFYPEISYQQLKQKGPVRAGAHSDYGTITLLIQKPGFGQNGLQALNSQKKWVKVNPPDYSIVVNLGDLFQHWTNDVLKSTIHKVQTDQQILPKLEKGQLQNVPERQTLVLFCDPDQGQIFQCLQGFGMPKYEPIDGKSYVIGRVNTTYKK